MNAISVIPLTILPLIIFNIAAFAVGYNVWDGDIFKVTMISGQEWSFKVGDLMIIVGLICLFFEVLRSTSSGSRIITNHALSTVVLILFIIEFIVVGRAAHSIFFTLMIMALFDVLSGFTITVKTAQRTVDYHRTADSPP